MNECFLRMDQTTLALTDGIFGDIVVLAFVKLTTSTAYGGDVKMRSKELSG